jgi:hypothetical protein
VDVRNGSAFLLAAALAVLAAPAQASAGSADVAATQTYLQANYTLVQIGGAKLKAGEAALASYRRRIEGECANAAARSPQDPESTKLSNELIGGMVTSTLRVDLPAIANFIRAVQGLHWSNHKLTSTIQSYVGKLRVLSKLAVPDECADVRAWVSSGYRTLPASTVQFDAQFEPNWVALGELPTGLLAPYERPSQKGLLRRTTQLEDKLVEFEAGDGVETWGEMMNSLVLNP